MIRWPQPDSLVRALLAFALVSAGCAQRQQQQTATFELYSGRILAIRPAGDRAYARLLVLRYENRADRATPVECAFDPVLSDGSMGSRRYVTSPKIPAGGTVRFQTITELAAQPDAIEKLRLAGCKAAGRISEPLGNPRTRPKR